MPAKGREAPWTPRSCSRGRRPARATWPTACRTPTSWSRADSGLEHALGLGFDVDLVVGDLDSVDAGVLALTRARAASRSSGTRPRRTPPTWSSRSTRRSPGASGAPRWSAVTAAASTTCSPTCCSSRRRVSPSSSSTRYLAARPHRRRTERGRRCTATSARSARSSRSAAPATGVTHHLPALPARRRGPAARVDARREQRADRARRRRSGSPRACCSPCNPSTRPGRHDRRV